MTERTSFEQRVTQWLNADAPSPAPAAVLETALERIADRRQDRYATQRLFGERFGRSPVLRWAIVVMLIAAALAGAVAVVGDGLARPRPPSIGAFGPGPLLAIGRESHTTTRLADGRVIVLGGQTHPDQWVTAAESTELWDPMSGDSSTFVRGRPLLEARSQHTATLLLDGRVLVVGGSWWDGAALVIRASAEVWDPATDTFSPGGTLARARYDHTATLLPDGRVLIAGGDSGQDPDVAPIASLEVWDPATSAFSPAGQMRTSRSGHTALLLADRRVFVVGNTDSDLWDPTTGAVIAGPSLVEPRYFHTATLLQDGRVLVTGGMWGTNADIVVRASAEVWDPATNSFALLDSVPITRASQTATLLLDGRVLIAGGDDAQTAEVWNPSTGTFSATGPTIEERSGATATLLADGRVLVVGAMSRRGIPRMTEIWDPIGQPVPSWGRPRPATHSTPPPVPESGD